MSNLRQRAQQAANLPAVRDNDNTPAEVPAELRKDLRVGQLIQGLRPEIARALPKHMDADRIARLALTVIRKDTNLANCDPQSFAGALLTAAALGLEPGVNGEAYLVAYKRECQLIVGYQGFVKLFWQSPYARHIDCQAVYSNDDFDYAYGLEPFLRHKPARGNRGEVEAYYAVASLSTGGSAFVVLTPEEVRELRGGKVGPKGDIPDPMGWMERKTALRQLVKLLPKSAMLAHALDADERMGTELRTEEVPQQITGSGDRPELTPPPATEQDGEPPADVAPFPEMDKQGGQS